MLYMYDNEVSYMEKKIANKIISIMNENGIFVDCYDDAESAFEMDSLTFLSTIVDIEENFKVSIPAEFLGNDFKTYLDFINTITEILLSSLVTYE